MTLAEAQRTGQNSNEFYVFSVKGIRYRCRWVNAQKGLFDIIQREGKPTKEPIRCDVEGSPDARAEAI